MPNNFQSEKGKQVIDALSPVEECPVYSTATLEAILEGQSTEAEADELSTHLTACAACRGRIHELLTRSDPLKPGLVCSSQMAESFAGLKSGYPRLQTPYPSFRTLGPGEFIGRFEISKVLGKGGTSIVYECVDHSMGRRVAVKVLNRNAFDATNLARLEREAQSLALLDHPGIVRAYETYSQHDPPFLVMELVGGGTACDSLKDGPIPHREAARLIAEVAEAVHQAHEQGILHRDIKPSNLLIEHSIQFETATEQVRTRLKISDFGLARSLANDSGLTTSGAIVGTPSYMSPEQTTGRQAEIGAASDIYSLGAVLYEFLAGRPPLVADNALRTMQRIQEEEPLPPRSILGTIPADLETICLKCLSKKPEDRYRTALELARDLRRFQQGRPILARPVSWLERLRRWVNRNRALSTALATSVILTAALVVVTVRFAIEQNRLRIEADANAEKARQNAEKFEATAKELLIGTDHTRNFLFTGIQNLDTVTKELTEVHDHEQAMRLSQKARALNEQAVNRYIARPEIAAENAKGDKIDVIFRDGRNLMLVGMKEQGTRLLERIWAMAKASRPGDPDRLRLLQHGISAGMVLAQEREAAGQPREAMAYLVEAWKKLGFRPDEPGVNRDLLTIRTLLFEQLTATDGKLGTSLDGKLSADELASIRTEAKAVYEAYQKAASG